MELVPPSRDPPPSSRCKVQRLKGEYGLTHVWEVQGQGQGREGHTHPASQSGTGSMSPDSAYLTYQGQLSSTMSTGASSIGTFPGPGASGSGSGRVGSTSLHSGQGHNKDHIYESPHLLGDGTRIHRSPLPCCRQFVEPPKVPPAASPVVPVVPLVPDSPDAAPLPPPPPETSTNRLDSTDGSGLSDGSDDENGKLTLNFIKPKGYQLVQGSTTGEVPPAPPRERKENHYT